MAVSVVSFSFFRGAQPDDGFLYCILSATSLGPNSIWGPEGPFGLLWLSLPHHLSYSISNCLTSVFTELYNSSTPTQSPTQSLELHVWLSSSGNNCHALQRSLSSGASGYECIMGFFTLSHFVSQFPPTRFPLITAIGMCDFLPVHHFGMASLAGSNVNIQHDDEIPYIMKEQISVTLCVSWHFIGNLTIDDFHTFIDYNHL